MQRKIDKSTIIVGDLNISTIIIDIMRRQKASKKAGDNTINQFDLIGNYRTFYYKQQNKYFSSANKHSPK